MYKHRSIIPRSLVVNVITVFEISSTGQEMDKRMCSMKIELDIFCLLAVGNGRPLKGYKLYMIKPSRKESRQKTMIKKTKPACVLFD